MVLNTLGQGPYTYYDAFSIQVVMLMCNHGKSPYFVTL
jgi:hypothetical protein